MIRHQRVPGYTGHIKGLVSENIFSESYGNTTARAVGKVHPIGHDIEPKVRFLSQNTSVYRPTNFRRFIDQPSMIPKKDYLDYSRFINDTFAEEKEEILNKTVENFDLSGHKPTKQYNPLSTLRTYSENPNGQFMTKRKHRAKNLSMVGQPLTDVEKKLGSTMNDFDVKPKILEGKIGSRNEFMGLSDGFKKIFASDNKD